MRLLSLHTAFRIAVLLFCYCFVAGCSKAQYLNIKNEYDHAIVVKQHFTDWEGKSKVETLGTIQPHAASTYRTDIFGIVIEDSQHNVLEKVDPFGKNVTSKNRGCTGSILTHYVTVAPKSSTSPAVVRVY